VGDNLDGSATLDPEQAEARWREGDGQRVADGVDPPVLDPARPGLHPRARLLGRPEPGNFYRAGLGHAPEGSLL
jgi:hypothetical protein